ncbi:hypothetical protein CesoFtcFv8_011954 [Champsocephalus esox]|uniref:Uncharacterized protein n=1 Tax=Champsocephalus esox TaxID=159716 RepID=A0AAN8GY93_9TELE|nr:hypothetical protein CesoFtcFv8_011954 [Champsocephalus esox]
MTPYPKPHPIASILAYPHAQYNATPYHQVHPSTASTDPPEPPVPEEETSRTHPRPHAHDACYAYTMNLMNST